MASPFFNWYNRQYRNRITWQVPQQFHLLTKVSHFARN